MNVGLKWLTNASVVWRYTGATMSMVTIQKTVKLILKDCSGKTNKGSCKKH
jgi:hypothetical protein